MNMHMAGDSFENVEVLLSLRYCIRGEGVLPGMQGLYYLVG